MHTHAYGAPVHMLGQPAVWRGPMVNSAFDRMAIGSDWGKLDVMIVDMPPGRMAPGPLNGCGPDP